MSASVRVVKNDFPKLAVTFEERMADAINNGINNAVEAADPKTPVDLGFLKANKTVTYASAGSLQGSIGWNQEYALWVHDGTKYMEGRPFAQQAVDEITPAYLNEL